MRTQSLDLGWSLQRQTGTPQTPGVPVDLPHDWSVTMPRRPDAPSGASGGYFQGAELHYERTFFVDAGDSTVLLEFEGVYANAEVRVNGHLTAVCHYGYSGFIVDATERVERGADNRLKVVVNANARPDARWYSGAGIYRHVWLHTAVGPYIHPWGLAVETEALEDGAAHLVAVVDLGGAAAGAALHVAVLGADGEVVLETECAASAGTVRHPFVLPAPRLWAAETPELYTMRCTLTDGNTADTLSVPFGVRTIAVDGTDGLRINGKTVKLRGGCIHHDNGILGAASFDAAEERKVRLMKASGYNAVRCAHNPPAPGFLRACDRLGLYVMDEAFDVWREGKCPYDYHQYFDRDWQKDLTAMVRRDRRHPSVILWSTGNEIPERDGRLNGYETARQLFDLVKRLDATRPVINCMNNIGVNTELTNLEANLVRDDPGFDLWGSRTRPFSDFLDVVGYNYLLARYGDDAGKFPGRVICGTESFPLQAADNWAAVEGMPHVIGDFVWTAIDYLGESGIGHVRRGDGGDKGFLRPWPWHQANCGDIDLCGHKRPQSFFRDAVWGIDSAPCVAVMPPDKWGVPMEVSPWGWPDVALHWDFPGCEGMETGVEVYSSCDAVELFLNGISLGRKPSGRASGFKTEFAVTYQPGELKVVGYRAGRPAVEHALKTPGPAACLLVEADKASLAAGRGDIAYLEITAVDGEGLRVARFQQEISLFVAGAAELQAMGTADTQCTEDYTGPRRSAYDGHVTAVIRAAGSGTVTVTAAAEGLPATVLTLVVGGE